MTREMLTPVKDESGLGFFLQKENPGQFGHNGADDGFQALLTMNADTGNGAAIMVNSDNGISLADFLISRIAQEYAWNYKAPQQNSGQSLFLIAKLKGPAAALGRYDELKASHDPSINEGTLNDVGYQLLYSGNEADAVQVFQRSVQEYPRSSNVYDSLGEAYAKRGQKDLAIHNYEKSLQLDPKNENAVRRLKKLKGDRD